MDVKLAEALVVKNLLPAGTEVRAKYKGVGLGSVTKVLVTGDFSITNTKIREDGRIVFYLSSVRDGATTTVLEDAIQEIDGMDPVRFANVYNIGATGDKLVLGKRRGRKPKNRPVDDF